MPHVKILCLHHRLGSYTSHHYNEAHGMLEESRRRGHRLELLIHRNASKEIARALDARAVFDDPTFRREWSFDERSSRFVSMLHAHVDRRVRAGDCVLTTISTQLEAHALTRWLQERPSRKKPWIAMLFLSDRWNRGTREEYERQMAELHTLRALLASLAPDDARKLIFFAVTPALAEDLTEILGTPFEATPMPLTYGDLLPKPLNARPRVAILGGTRPEKGSYLIPAIIDATRNVADVEFLVHLTNNALSDEESARLSRIASEPNVIVIPDALNRDDYLAAINSADLALFPYEVISYTKRSSGVFAEAVAYGVPVLATPGTWMATQIHAGRAAGAVFDELTAAAIARSIALAVANLDALRAQAATLIEPWRKSVSVANLFDQLEQEIASRARQEPQRRWWDLSLR